MTDLLQEFQALKGLCEAAPEKLCGCRSECGCSLITNTDGQAMFQAARKWLPILLRALELACTPTCVVMETEEDQRALVDSLMDVQIRRAQEAGE